MYLKASAHPKYDPAVVTLQRKLNAIKNKVHANWPDLGDDGKFGEQTKQAVIGYQKYRGITPALGEVGDTTMKYINDSFNQVPQLKAAPGQQCFIKSGSSKQYKDSWKVIIKKINDYLNSQAYSILNDIQDQYDKQAKNAALLKNYKVSSTDLQILLRRHLNGSSNFKALQTTVQNILDNNGKMKTVSSGRKVNTNAYNYASRKDTLRLATASKAQSAISKGNTMAKQLYNQCMAEMKNANIAGFIDKSIKKHNTGSFKVKGSGVLAAISFIPLVVAIVNYCMSPSADGLKKIGKELINLLEGMIIGAIVAAVVAFLGITGGVAIVVIVVVCFIIGLLIALFCPGGSVLEWLGKEIIKTINSPVFQSAARTSFV